MAPPRSPSLRLRSRCALRSKKPLASSLRAPLTPAATGETCHWHLSPAVRLSRGSPHASLAHTVSARASLAATQPRSRIHRTPLNGSSRCVRWMRKMYIATHTPNPWRARGDDLALRGLLVGLPRQSSARGSRLRRSRGSAASLRQAGPSTAAWQSAREWGSARRSRRRAQSQPRARLHVPLAFAFLAWSSFRHRDLN